MLLETEWVLRYSYEIPQESILATMRRLLGYHNLQVEDRASVLQALSLFAAGVDFADALHLASSTGAERFATFDRALAQRATKAKSEGLPRIELLASKKR